MGVLYSVLPLTHELRPAMRDWGFPDVPFAEARNPTPAEIRGVLSNLPGYRAFFNDPPTIGTGWQAEVEDASDAESGAWTLVNMSEYPGEDVPGEVWFEKGWPDLIVQTLVRLAARTGPLVLVADCGGSPLLIRATDDPA